VDILRGNSAKAEKLLGWKAETKFGKLVSLMVKADLEKVLVKGY